MTGCEASSIYGTLDTRTNMPEANFFLLNPRGVAIGPAAVLDVGGSFHASTADYLRFADTMQYFADLERDGGSTLTAAAPAAFGFLGLGDASVVVEGSSLAVRKGRTLSLMGGEVQVAGATLSAPGGLVHLAAQKLGEIPLRPAGLASAAAAGKVSVSDSTIEAGGDTGGTVLIRGGLLVLDRSTLKSGTSGGADGAALAVGVQAAGRLAMTDTNLQSETSGDGSGGGIVIEAETAVFANGEIATSNSSFGAAAGGSIWSRRMSAFRFRVPRCGRTAASVPAAM